LQQASDNEAASVYLEGTHNDWAVTALFYAALHYVDMYFATHGPVHTFASHGERSTAIQAYLTPIWADYKVLLEESWHARYHCSRYTASDVRNFRRNELKRIKDHLRQLGVQIP